jgi:hypothetical protein
VAEYVRPSRAARQIVAEADEVDYFRQPAKRGFGFQFGALQILSIALIRRNP